MIARKRYRDKLPFPYLLPSLVTIIGLCAALTSIRMTFSDRFALAAGLIIFAAIIDGLDGLLARRLNSASSFGAELDSLCDFVNFGVAPGLLVYQFALTDASDLGWTMVLVYVVCCCLRLARFNVNRDLPTPGARAHFVGVPAPAGALLGLLPVFLSLEGLLATEDLPILVAPYIGLVGLLMISQVPTFSPKSVRVSRDKAVWLLVATAVIIGLMVTRFWLLLILLDAVYVLALLRAAIASRFGTRILTTSQRKPHGD